MLKSILIAVIHCCGPIHTILIQIGHTSERLGDEISHSARHDLSGQKRLLSEEWVLCSGHELARESDLILGRVLGVLSSLDYPYLSGAVGGAGT